MSALISILRAVGEGASGCLATVELVGHLATIEVMSVCSNMASVLIDSEVVGNADEGPPLRLNGGRGLWDGCT